MKSSKLILTLAVIIAVASLLVLVVTMDKFGITGRAFDTGTANISIDDTASVSFTVSNCNFGSGYVLEAPVVATVYSDGTPNSNASGWTGCANGLEITNDGNSAVNFTLTSDANAADFIGSGATMQFKAVSTTCDGTDTLSSYTTVDKTAQLGCTNWSAGSTSQIDFVLTIPEAASGTGAMIITATSVVL